MINKLSDLIKIMHFYKKGSRFKLKFDGMIHYLDIPKTQKHDEGTVRCYAKNIHGEVETSALLKVNAKTDFRSMLKNAKTGERHVPEVEPVRERSKSSEKQNFYQVFKNIILMFKNEPEYF